jgi:hypothetical protein
MICVVECGISIIVLYRNICACYIHVIELVDDGKIYNKLCCFDAKITLPKEGT